MHERISAIRIMARIRPTIQFHRGSAPDYVTKVVVCNPRKKYRYTVNRRGNVSASKTPTKQPVEGYRFNQDQVRNQGLASYDRRQAQGRTARAQNRWHPIGGGPRIRSHAGRFDGTQHLCFDGFDAAPRCRRPA